jgi:hypothetical protein
MTTLATRPTVPAAIYSASTYSASTLSGPPAKTVAAPGAHDWRDRKVREWLLLLLRFAITRKPSDQSAVLAAADELDNVALRWRPTAPRFFVRTSHEVCHAILAIDEMHDNAVLRSHVARIDDPRLRRAFQAAVGLQPAAQLQQQGAKRKRPKAREKACRKNEQARSP